MCPYMSQSTIAKAVQVNDFMNYAWNWPPSLSGQQKLNRDASALTRERKAHVAFKLACGCGTKHKGKCG